MIDAAGLRVMRAIAEEGSFTAAAASLGYTQPAISQMVRRLEQRTGTVLVERLGRSVRLTEAGLVLARHAGPVLAALDAAEEEVAAIAGLRSGRVRLLAFPSATATIVPRALALVRDRFPGVSISFTEAEPPEALAALRAGEGDVAVTFSYEGSDAAVPLDDHDLFIATPLLEDEVRLTMPISHPLAAQPCVAMADLRDETWIAGCPRCRGHLVDLADDAGFTPTVAFETEDYAAVLGLVAEGLGVALNPDLILGTIQNPGVAAVPLEPRALRRVQAVTTPDMARVPAVAATVEALVESARQRMAHTG